MNSEQLAGFSPFIMSPERRLRAQADRERAVVQFATMQMLALIYLQKFGLFPGQFPLGFPMLIFFAGIGWMVVRQHLYFSPPRLICYTLFAGSCLYAMSLTGGSMASLMQLLMIYFSFTLCADLTEAAYRTIFNRFIKLMTLPALIIVGEYYYQVLTGTSNPLNIEHYVSRTFLIQGWPAYETHYPWNSFFIRPNGFFFLEPSYASMFTASAAIIEITLFRRVLLMGLMIAATALSTGATGMSMLAIAAPFLLARQSPYMMVLLAILLLTVVAGLTALDIPLPLMSRAGELQHDSSSGYSRVMLPAMLLMEHALDPAYLFLGDGAGSLPTEAGVVWPFTKLVYEYGLCAMLAFAIFYLVAIVGNTFNLALKVALSFEYLFTGGYLLSAPMVELLFLLLFLCVPVRSDR